MVNIGRFTIRIVYHRLLENTVIHINATVLDVRLEIFALIQLGLHVVLIVHLLDVLLSLFLVQRLSGLDVNNSILRLIIHSLNGIDLLVSRRAV